MDKPETTTERHRAEDIQRGREQMRDQIIEIIKPCLDRDPTLQILIARIELMS